MDCSFSFSLIKGASYGLSIYCYNFTISDFMALLHPFNKHLFKGQTVNVTHNACNGVIDRNAIIKITIFL